MIQQSEYTSAHKNNIIQGIIKFLINKKEEQKEEVKMEVQEEQPPSKGMVYNYGQNDYEMLCSYADKDIPVYMVGGDFSDNFFVVGPPTDIMEKKYQTALQNLVRLKSATKPFNVLLA